MTKARDLSNLISTGVPNSLITLDANEIPNIDASKITTGQFADARIADLNASKLTGSIADARIPASAVSQHATSFDDNKIVNDISTLALRQASNENKGAYNTNSMYVDVFQDATGITNLTNSLRNASEYMTSESLGNSDSSVFTISDTNVSSYLTGTQGSYKVSNSAFNYYDNDNDSSGQHPLIIFENSQTFAPATSHFYHVFRLDFGSGKSFSLRSLSFTHRSGYGGLVSNGIKFYGFNTLPANNTSTPSDLQVIQSFYNQTNPTSHSHTTTSGVQQDFYRYMGITYQYTSNNEPQVNDVELQGIYRQQVPQFNATGSFESNAITASSSTNKMGAIITYQDFAGTNALNTDIVLKLSADGGSNYATATLTAMPDFATGIKMAKVNDLSVTAGTSLKYKIEFANQASGSKEARIRGVSLQY